MTDSDPVPTAGSARALRERLQTETGLERRWTLISKMADALAHLERAEALRGVLLELSQSVAAAHALIARIQAGRYEVMASLGVAPPPATRLPMQGSMAAVAKWPAKTLLLPNVMRSAWCVGRQLGYELLVPASLGGEVVGLLALADEPHIGPPPGEDVATLETTAALLAPLLQPAPGARNRLSEKDRRVLASLTRRETEVLSLLPRGLSNAELATQLGIAPGTVKIHVERILRKLDVQDRAQAAARAVEWRIGSSL